MCTKNQPTAPCQQQLPNTIWYLQLEPPDTGGKEQPETLQKVAVATGKLGEPATAAYCFNQSHNPWVPLSLPETRKEVARGEGKEQHLKPLQHPCTISELILMLLSFKTGRHQKYKEKLSYSFLKRKQKISATLYRQRKAQATIWLKCIGNNTEPLNGLFDYSDLEETLSWYFSVFMKELKSAFMFSLQQLRVVKKDLQPQHEIPFSQESQKA